MKAHLAGSSINHRTMRDVTLIMALLVTLHSTMRGDSLHIDVSGGIVQDISDGIGDVGSFFSAPGRFEAHEWLTAAGIVGAIPLVMVADNELHQRLGKRDLSGSEHSGFPAYYGDIRVAGLLAIGTYSAGLLVDDDEMRATGGLLIKAILISSMTTMTIRFISARSRPPTGDGSWKFNGFTWKDDVNSFPSGHTTVAFAVSSVLAQRADNVWLSAMLYGLATATAFSRVYNHQHWVSDVLVGGGIGLLAGFHVGSNEHQRRAGSGFTLSPDRRGLTMMYVFSP
jgi:hypothetical protein